MLSIREGQERVDRRFARLEPSLSPTDGTVPVRLMALLCSGTDLIGPELERELDAAAQRLLELLAVSTCDCEPEPPALNCSSPPFVVGALVQTFFLGFELGKVESEAER